MKKVKKKYEKPVKTDKKWIELIDMSVKTKLKTSIGKK